MRDHLEEFRQRQVRYHGVVYVEQKFQPIPFASNLCLQGGRVLIVQRVLYGDGNLARSQLLNFELIERVGMWRRMSQTERAQLPPRGAQRDAAERSHSVFAHQLDRARKSVLAIQIVEDQGLLIRPHPGGRRLVHGKFHARANRVGAV